MYNVTKSFSQKKKKNVTKSSYFNIMKFHPILEIYNIRKIH